MKHSDRVPARKRAIAIAEIGVLLALGALVVLAVIVGGSADDATDIAPEVAPAPEPDESTGIEVAGTSPPVTNPAPTTSTATALSVDDDTAIVGTLVTEQRESSAEPEATIPESEVTSSSPEITALVEGPFVEIDIGEAFACGLLEDGRVKCWGGGRATDSAPQHDRFAQIDAGHDTVCGLSLDGELSCWGFGEYLTTGDDYGPHTSVALGFGVLCALRHDGVILCSESDTKSEHHKITSHDFTEVAAGDGAICALDVSGSAVCWAGNFSDSRLPEVAPPKGPFEQILLDVDGLFACAIRTDGTAACWGDAPYIPWRDLTGPFSHIAVGVVHACGLHPTGWIACWGGSSTAQPIAHNGEFVDVSAGAQHSCGLRQNGKLQCWGRGWGSDASDEVPSGSFVAVESRYFRNCAIRSDGAAVCWGQPF